MKIALILLLAVANLVQSGSLQAMPNEAAAEPLRLLLEVSVFQLNPPSMFELSL